MSLKNLLLHAFTPKLTKRGFLKSLSAGALTAGLGTKASAQEELWDVIIIGGGNAGLPTAIFAAERNAKVLIIEIAAQLGGTLFLSTGQMSAAGTKLQKSKGITGDTPQSHFDDIMRLSNNTAVPEIVELAVFNAAETFDWLTDNGLEVLPEHPVKGVVHDPYSYARYAWGADGGISILEVLEKQLQPHLDSGQVTAKTRSEVTGLIQDEDGAVRGVTVKNEDGSTSEFLGRQTVITSGGYASNPEMFERLEGAVDYSDSSYPYSQGAGLTIGEAAGGYIRGGEHHLPLFGAILGDDNYPSPMTAMARNNPLERLPWEIYVDANGKRFMKEDTLTHTDHELALLEIENEECWLVFDDAILKQATPVVLGWTREEVTEAFDGMPMFYKADTLDALADSAGIDGAGLTQTIANFNKAQAGESKDELGRTHMPLPIAEGPYYAIRLNSWLLTGFAGLAVDKDLHVIREDGTPIPNLYAAGEVLGSAAFMGQSYCGGMLVTPALTFGRLLGQKLLQISV